MSLERIADTIEKACKEFLEISQVGRQRGNMMLSHKHKLLISKISKKHQVPYDTIRNILYCESHKDKAKGNRR